MKVLLLAAILATSFVQAQNYDDDKTSDHFLLAKKQFENAYQPFPDLVIGKKWSCQTIEPIGVPKDFDNEKVFKVNGSHIIMTMDHSDKGLIFTDNGDNDDTNFEYQYSGTHEENGIVKAHYQATVRQYFGEGNVEKLIIETSYASESTDKMLRNLTASDLNGDLWASSLEKVKKAEFADVIPVVEIPGKEFSRVMDYVVCTSLDSDPHGETQVDELAVEEVEGPKSESLVDKVLNYINSFIQE
jgi:hypothetical protein